jgi:VanZ family protein
MAAIRNNSVLVRFLIYWLPVIIFAILIFYASSMPGEQIPDLFPFQSTIFHIAVYAIFAMLINRALKAHCPKMGIFRIFFWVFFLSFSFAVSDELHQVFVPGRTPSLYDITCDTIGTIIGGTFYRWLK